MKALFTLTGTVVKGQGRGRGVGMPTANIDVQGAPVSGVFATVARFDGMPRVSVTNVGARPSVDDSPRVTVETHILDFSGDLYGKTVSLDFYIKLRDTVNAGSLENVKRQVDLDIQRAKDYFVNMFP